MQQFRLDLQAFNKGLRIHKYMPYNRGMLIKAFGYRVGEFGLEPIEYMENQFTSDFYFSDNFAQKLRFLNVVNSRYYCLLINYTDIYVIDRANGNITKLTNYFPYSLNNLKLTVIDFDTIIYIHNGEKFFKFDGETLLPVGHINCKDSCFNLGRVFLGGIKGNKDINIPDDNESVINLLDEKTLWWSTIGGENFISELGETEKDILRDMATLETGFLHYEGIGEIQAIEPYYDSIMVYGTYGIAEVRQILEPIHTMSVKIVSNLGIVNHSRVCNGRFNHLLITGENELYQLSYNEYQIVEVAKIGCKEYIDEMGEQIRMTYNPDKREYYVASDKYSLIITNGGVTQIDAVVQGVVHIDGKTTPLLTKTNKLGDCYEQ